MNPPDSQRPADRVAFFGKITASVTHELNNVISIVEQNAGLLDDLIAGEERGIPLSIERLALVSSAIQKQTGRGLKIIARLNRFAHTTDHAETVFVVNEVVENLVGLAGRLAGLKEVELVYQPAADSPKITGNPFALQRAVFDLIIAALPWCGPGRSLTIATAGEPSDVVVSVSYEANKEPDPDTLAALADTVPLDGATLTSSRTDYRVRVELRFATGPEAG